MDQSSEACRSAEAGLHHAGDRGPARWRAAVALEEPLGDFVDYRAVLAAHALQVALVRPDRYVFGGGTPAESSSLMKQLLGKVRVHSQVVV
ncbi:MAG: hypothetical protein ACLQUY_04475 [Ktedonobacterales bacterium]